jgi:hypothetical protein
MIEARYVLRSDDGDLISVRNRCAGRIGAVIISLFERVP